MDAPGERPAEESLADALALRTQVRRGVVAGVMLAAAVFGLFVLLPGTDRSPVLFLGLAFVVAATAAGLVTTVLVARAAHRLTREL